MSKLDVASQNGGKKSAWRYEKPLIAAGAITLVAVCVLIVCASFYVALSKSQKPADAPSATTTSTTASTSSTTTTSSTSSTSTSSTETTTTTTSTSTLQCGGLYQKPCPDNTCGPRLYLGPGGTCQPVSLKTGKKSGLPVGAVQNWI